MSLCYQSHYHHQLISSSPHNRTTNNNSSSRWLKTISSTSNSSDIPHPKPPRDYSPGYSSSQPFSTSTRSTSREHGTLYHSSSEESVRTEPSPPQSSLG